MPILKKSVKYRRKTSKTDGCDIIPLEDREVSRLIYEQFEEIKPDKYSGKTE
jgi:hypothetical protein